jgi:small subunit ribosomal protein S1
MTEDPWIHAIPEKYIPGHIIKGKVVKLTNFGAFVELEAELEGLLHISELADHKIDKPQDVVKVGDEIEVKILKVDTESRKIGLSLRRVRWAAEEHASDSGKWRKRAPVQSAAAETEQSVMPAEQASSGQATEQASGHQPGEPSKQEVEPAKQESESAGQGAGDVAQSAES